MNSSEAHKQASDRLSEIMKKEKGIKTSAGVYALINVMHLNFRDEGQGKEAMLANAALLSGMATAILLDHAKDMERKGK